jgi:hypothetical protein
MSVALKVISRKGAEKAEIAEWHMPSRSILSAASAFSAPLRETNSALRARAVL